MRRFDPFTMAFFMPPVESDWLANFRSARLQLREPEPPEDPAEEPINSWEHAWIDLGGEG